MEIILYFGENMRNILARGHIHETLLSLVSYYKAWICLLSQLVADLTEAAL